MSDGRRVTPATAAAALAAENPDAGEEGRRTRVPPLIRRAVAADLGSLLAIERTGFGGGDAFSRRQMRYLVLRAKGGVFVAECEGVAAGYVCVLLRPRQGRIYSLAVDPARRGRGIAEALLVFGVEFARQAGAEAVFLEVGVGNGPAFSLYTKKGFATRGLRPGYYHDGTDAFSMALRFSGPPVPRVP